MDISLLCLSMMLINLSLVAYTVRTFHLHLYSIVLVFGIALILTALVMYNKINALISKYSRHSTLLSGCVVVAIAAMIFLQLSMFHYSLPLWAFATLIAGIETYLIRSYL